MGNKTFSTTRVELASIMRSLGWELAEEHALAPFQATMTIAALDPQSLFERAIEVMLAMGDRAKNRVPLSPGNLQEIAGLAETLRVKGWSLNIPPLLQHRYTAYQAVHSDSAKDLLLMVNMLQPPRPMGPRKTAKEISEQALIRLLEDTNTSAEDKIAAAYALGKLGT